MTAHGSKVGKAIVGCSLSIVAAFVFLGDAEATTDGVPSPTEPEATEEQTATTPAPLPPPPPSELVYGPRTVDEFVTMSIRTGRVIQVGDLLVTRPKAKNLAWQAVNKICTLRRAPAPASWRLPTRDELQTIDAVRPLPPGGYWTDSAAGDPDTVSLFEAGSRSFRPADVSEFAGTVLCVLDTRRADSTARDAP
jgi:hypothetical protein